MLGDSLTACSKSRPDCPTSAALDAHVAAPAKAEAETKSRRESFFIVVTPQIPTSKISNVGTPGQRLTQMRAGFDETGAQC
jgi:hypothetical protein